MFMKDATPLMPTRAKTADNIIYSLNPSTQKNKLCYDK